jgi:hypothetical protein
VAAWLESSSLDSDQDKAETLAKGVVMPHPGINMHKIPVGGDEIGVMFVIGVLLPMLIALPEVRNFILVSLPIGVIIAIILRLIHRD